MGGTGQATSAQCGGLCLEGDEECFVSMLELQVLQQSLGGREYVSKGQGMLVIKRARANNKRLEENELTGIVVAIRRGRIRRGRSEEVEKEE